MTVACEGGRVLHRIRTGEPILEVDKLTVTFGEGPGSIAAVEGVSLEVQEGDIYALVGESGCGKSTLAYSLLDIVPPPGHISGGEVRFKGRSIAAMSRRELSAMRGAEVAMSFQAAMNAFNPVITIGTQVGHVLHAHPEAFPNGQAAGREHFEYLLELVRLSPDRIWNSFESQLSGGIKQRLSIALALLLKPSVVILDEPTTALDVLSQRLVIDVLKELHRSLGLTIIFVTHDLAVVAELASRIAVMYAGRLVETGTVGEIFAPGRRHPYIAALMAAIPSVLETGVTVRPIPGQVPNLAELPPGCRFAPRCAFVQPICTQAEPRLCSDDKRHMVACHMVNKGLEAVKE